MFSICSLLYRGLKNRSLQAAIGTQKLRRLFSRLIFVSLYSSRRYYIFWCQSMSIAETAMVCSQSSRRKSPPRRLLACPRRQRTAYSYSDEELHSRPDART